MSDLHATTSPLSLKNEIRSLRRVNEIPFRPALAAAGLGALTYSLAISGTQSGDLTLLSFAIISGGLSAFLAFKVVRHRPKMRFAAQTEFKSGDYSRMYYVANYLPLLIWFSIIPVNALGISEWAVPPIVQSLVKSVTFIAAVAFPFLTHHRQVFTIGRRRAQKILQTDDLEGVTQQRLESAEEHSIILAACFALGAVDGNEATITDLTKIISAAYPAKLADDIVNAVKELNTAGLIKITGLGLYHDPLKYPVSLTPLGVRCCSELQRR